jgi:hypothetical protein
VRDHAPGRKSPRELERVAARVAAESARDRRRVAGDGQVVVGGLATEQPVAERAAHQPGTVGHVGERVKRVAHEAGCPSWW